ncbi:uncharacterized protein [Dendrobates tinctorius]|uniref:uncharacterized protein isoform X2 n=1 Tax=Dendrobates tinctorius TaxID=92724 RepID=UPI003CC96947
MDQTPSASSPDPQSLEAAETSAQPSTFPDCPRRLSSQEPSKITAKSPQVTLTETLDLPDGGDGDKQEKVDDCLMKDIRTHKLKSEKTKPENDVGVGPDPMESLDAEPSGTLNMATTTTQMKRPKIAGNMEKCDVNFQEYQERSGDQANQCTIGEELSINPSSDVLLADLFGDECCDGYSISVHDQEVSEIVDSD